MADLSKHILLCPGQGSQKVGMGRAWAEASSSAAALFRDADTALGFGLSQLCFEGPQEQLDRTDVAQLAIYTVSVACARGLTEKGLLTGAVAAPSDASGLAATAGLSLGEFTALHLAGTLSFEAGLELVRVRGEAMQQAAESVDSSMVALTGADEASASALCEKVLADFDGSEHVLVPANINGPGQIVISGTQEACQRAITMASDEGGKATGLQVAGAFHSRVMAPAAAALESALQRAPLEPPRCPVISNVTGKPHLADVDAIRQRLVEQMTNPVRWLESMQWVGTHLEGQLIELAPGRVLTGLMRRIDRRRPVANCAEPATATGAPN